MKTKKASRTTQVRRQAQPAVELIEDTVDKGARAAEEIHRSISDLPFNVLHRLGLLEQTTAEVKRIHDTSVEAIYETVRDVNHKVARLADNLFGHTGARPTKGAPKHSAAA